MCVYIYIYVQYIYVYMFKKEETGMRYLGDCLE